MTWNEKAEELEAWARGQHEAREASWERSDTDGFLSQWAHGLHDSLYQRQAEICRAGGMAWFSCLLDLEGRRVPARMITSRYGPCWAILDSAEKFTGEFVSIDLKPKAIRRKGYQYGFVLQPAWAKFYGKGHGLGGSCWVGTYPRLHPVQGVEDSDPTPLWEEGAFVTTAEDPDAVPAQETNT